ncbi:hypothetical protein ACQPZP_38305 [Spirillospora sp. CA-142024]|uniref:hypothetical protein n=1 Tax=Spirillospora sp. CA-142024 TaxID=3240036 RepID=UPI003D93D548
MTARKPVIAAIALAATAATLLTGAARASAEPATVGHTPGSAAGNPQIDCRGWLRPHPHIVTDAKPIYQLAGGSWTGEVHVTLWRGLTSTGPHYWATLTGKTRPGDAVWMDVNVKNGGGWHQCGPFGVGSHDQTISSPMGHDLHFHAFRACGRHNNDSGCTSDYYPGISRR